MQLETGQAPRQGEAGELAVTDEATIKPTRSRCQNCGLHLNGAYCHGCGQSSRSMIKFFGEVVKELLDDVLGYDSRLKHSIYPLFFQPGKLTQEYCKGRRFYYVMPFRFYLFASLIFILALQLNINPGELISTDASAVEIKQELGQAIDEINQAGHAEIGSTDGEVKSEIYSEGQTVEPAEINGDNQAAAPQGNAPTLSTKETSADLNSGKSVLAEADGQFAKNLFVDVLDKAKSKVDDWAKDPAPLIDQVFQLLPYMMFIILPLFALFIKVLYLFSKRFYVEHLVFTLHNHCFLYIAILLSMFMSYLQNLVTDSTHWIGQSLSVGLKVISFLLIWWIIFYVVLAMKRFYQQNWWMTLSKFVVLFLVYFTLTTIGLLTTILVGMYRA